MMRAAVVECRDQDALEEVVRFVYGHKHCLQMRTFEEPDTIRSRVRVHGCDAHAPWLPEIGADGRIKTLRLDQLRAMAEGGAHA